MLVKLNQGERLDPQALAEEFGVNLRTIQRDLNERFAYLPLEKTDGRYHLDPAFLGKLSTRDIERFASLAGVRGLFPSLSDEFLRDIFDARMQSALLVKGHHYEDLAGKEARSGCSSRRSWRGVTWRSSTARRRGRRRTRRWRRSSSSITRASGTSRGATARSSRRFRSRRSSGCGCSRRRSRRIRRSRRRCVDEDGIWLGEEKREIVLKISAEVAGYFKRRKLIANQVIEKDTRGRRVDRVGEGRAPEPGAADRALLDSAHPDHQSGGVAGGARGGARALSGGVDMRSCCLRVWLVLAAVVAVAEEPKTAAEPPRDRAQGLRDQSVRKRAGPGRRGEGQQGLRPTDAYGNTQYQKPGYVVKGDRIYADRSVREHAVPEAGVRGEG